MEYQIYNPGDVIEDSVKFSLSSDKTDHATGSWPFRLPSKAFTPIPTELELANDSTLRVEFPYDIIRKFGQRGVILLISEKEKLKKFGTAAIPDHQPYAVGVEEAQERGARLWGEYTYKIAQDYLNEAMQARAAGGVMRKALGFTARCLKLNNIMDPADEMYQRQIASGNDPAVTKRLQEMEGVMAMLLKLPSVQKELAAQGVAPEALSKPPESHADRELRKQQSPPRNSGHGKSNKLPDPKPVAAPGA